jgi:hypothetical protein
MKPEPIEINKDTEINLDGKQTAGMHLNHLLTKLNKSYERLYAVGPVLMKDRIPNVFNTQRRILALNEIFALLADLASECERFELWCDVQRKLTAEKYMLEVEHENGTIKYKELHANVQAERYRVNRDYFKGLAIMWRNRMTATNEEIQSLKWVIRDAHEVGRGN